MRFFFFDSVFFVGKFFQILEVISGIFVFIQVLNFFGVRIVGENLFGWIVIRIIFVYIQVSNYKLINLILYIKFFNDVFFIFLGVCLYKCDICEKEFNYLMIYK